MFVPFLSKATLNEDWGLKEQVSPGAPKVPVGIHILGSLGANIKQKGEGVRLLSFYED